MKSSGRIPRHYIVTYGDDGEIVHVSVSTSLEIVYEGIFKHAGRCLRRKPALIEHSIQAIVFGCFWLEARTNNVTQEILWRSLGKNRLRDLIWQQFKKSGIVEKLNLIGAHSAAEEFTQLRSLTPQLKKTFELRNRLAHFRAEDESVTDESINFEKMVEIIESFPETELMSDLTTPAVMNSHVTVIGDVANWLESVRSSKPAA